MEVVMFNIVLFNYVNLLFHWILLHCISDLELTDKNFYV